MGVTDHRDGIAPESHRLPGLRRDKFANLDNPFNSKTIRNRQAQFIVEMAIGLFPETLTKVLREKEIALRQPLGYIEAYKSKRISIVGSANAQDRRSVLLLHSSSGYRRTMTKPVLSIIDLEAGYGKTPILKNISLSLSEGEFVAIVGPNGSGKSTLMKSLIGYLPLLSGEILYRGVSLKSLGRIDAARQVALVPQTTVFHFPYRVYDYVLLGRRPYQGLFGLASEEDDRIAQEAMRRTETHHLRDRIVTELSGGERQRVVLAAAFAQQTSVLLLDEPTNSLDLRYQLQVYELLSEMKRKSGLAVMTVTHDLNLASIHADRIVVLQQGHMLALGTPEEIITSEMIEKQFGVQASVFIDKQTKRPYIVSKKSVSS